MAEPRHTPGPWHVGTNDGLSVEIYTDRESAFSPASVHNGGNDVEALANARLVAAAPALLDACECFLEASEGPARGLFDLENARALMRAAVEMAKGVRL
ncbi:MAG TPA: hypothetical protein VFX03_11425 [Thermomicrobiales bacterium]|nr:hypothetical protein [Thermomicrobiales bacterium]